MDNLIGAHGVYRNGREVGTLTVTQEGLMTIFELDSDYRTGEVLRLAGLSRGEYVSLGVAVPEAGRLRLKKKYSRSALAALELTEGGGFFLIKSGETPKAAPQQPEPPPEAKEPEKLPESERDEEKTAEPPEPPEPPPALVEMPQPERAKRADIPKPRPERPVQENADENSGGEEREDTAAAVQSGEWSAIEDPSVLFDDEDIKNACRNVKGALAMEKDGVNMLAIPASPGQPFPMMPVFCFGDSVRLFGKEYIVFKAKNGNFVF